MGQVRREHLLVSQGYSRDELKRVGREISGLKQQAQLEEAAIPAGSLRVTAGRLPAYLAWMGPPTRRKDVSKERQDQVVSADNVRRALDDVSLRSSAA